MSTFAVLASEDFESKQAQSRAVTAAIVRAQEMFDPYLSRASSAEDKADRILLIEEDLKRVAYAVSKEYGYADYRHLYATARNVLAGDNYDREDEAKCKSCGETFSNPEGEENICPDCRNDSGSGKPWEKGSKEWEKPWEQDDDEVDHYEVSDDDIADDDKGTKKKAAGEPETGDNYQSERVDLPSNSDTGLGGPSPKIDKGTAGDVAGTSQKPIDIGSKRHQHELQNATDRADYNAEDFDPSNPVRERVDADKPLQPEFTKAPATDTWSGTDGLAKPVTSKYEIVRLA